MRQLAALPAIGTPLYQVALAIWQLREQRHASRLQRMHPDPLDYATGAWAIVVQEAQAAVKAYEKATRGAADVER